MSKVLTLNSTKIKEIVIQPDSSTPLSVLYETLDTNDKTVHSRRVTMTLSSEAKEVLDSLVGALTDKTLTLEDI